MYGGVFMSERQSHGFSYEKTVIEKYGMEGSVGYTTEWDARYKGIPVSIKTKKIGQSVEMADFFRNSNKTEDFILVVGFWGDEKGVIVEEHFLYINKNYWMSQFDPLLVESFRNIFDGVTNSYEDDDKWKKRREDATKLWEEKGSIIKVNFKRDHKKQKRVQCSIKNKEFYDILVRYYTVELEEELNTEVG